MLPTVWRFDFRVKGASLTASARYVTHCRHGQRYEGAMLRNDSRKRQPM